jgi:hypothetical protein
MKFVIGFSRSVCATLSSSLGLLFQRRLTNFVDRITDWHLHMKRRTTLPELHFQMVKSFRNGIPDYRPEFCVICAVGRTNRSL